MSSEQNLPEVPSHQGPPPAQQGDSLNGSSSPHGMGQSKSSRRRRRKRKGKGDDFASDVMPPVASPAAVPSLQAQAAPQPASQNGGSTVGPNGQQFQQNSNGKRWKKKFRDRERPRFSDNPGNQASGSNTGYVSSAPSAPRDTNTHQFGNRSDGFKRKGTSSGGGGKQRDRGPRGFVGPMDHSYRVLSVGFSDTPPSTIEPNSSWSRSYQGGDSQPIDYSQGRTVPIPEDAPNRIFFFIEDLFFLAKINETARKLGVKVAFLKNEKEAVAELLALEEDRRPGLIVFDLNNANAKPMTLIPKIKAKFKRQTSVIGFLSHLQGDLKAKAVEAGCDTVMPRAAFSQNLPNLLRRYGIEDEHDEGNFNQ